MACFPYPVIFLHIQELIPFNALPYDKILDWSRLNTFANNKINVNKKVRFGLGWVENIVGKGETAGYQYFLLFPQCLQKASFSRSLKVGIGKELKKRN